jgi:very-short-patch-repair endonuclease
MLKKKTTEQFIKEARQVHGNKYDYSKVKYVGNKELVTIICPIHGEVPQRPIDHLRGRGCKYCAKPVHDTESFIKGAQKIHGIKYDYSKTKYIDTKTLVTIICPKHGEFQKTPNQHLHGQGCQKCSKENKIQKQYDDINKFIRKAQKKHGNKYDYSKVEYKGCRENVTIICKKHGAFSQMAYAHLRGEGCPMCKQSYLERDVQKILNENSIENKYNTKPEFLEGLEADFLLEKEKVIIECQGTQHLLKNHFFEPLNVVIERDIRKLKRCNENGYKMIYILNKENSKYRLDEQFNHMYDDALFIEDIIKDNNILLDKIKARLI